MSYRSLLALSGLLASSCGQIGNSQSDDRICATPPTEIAQGAWGDCIHRWAYRLARSPDRAETVAEATVAACGDAIAWQINNADESNLSAAGAAGRIALSNEIMASAPKLALFHVVQARAGNCDIP